MKMTHRGGERGPDLRYGYISAAFFHVGFVAKEGKFVRIKFYESLDLLVEECEKTLGAVHDPDAFGDFVHDLRRYFSGDKVDFDYPFEVNGTEFQLEVWAKVREIGYGQVKSYREIAIEIGRPRAYRAVANAIRSNKLSLLVPCHRVIRSDGSVAGSGFGKIVREYLLGLEGVKTRK